MCTYKTHGKIILADKYGRKVTVSFKGKPEVTYDNPKDQTLDGTYAFLTMYESNKDEPKSKQVSKKNLFDVKDARSKAKKMVDDEKSFTENQRKHLLELVPKIRDEKTLEEFEAIFERYLKDNENESTPTVSGDPPDFDGTGNSTAISTFGNTASITTGDAVTPQIQEEPITA